MVKKKNKLSDPITQGSISMIKVEIKIKVEDQNQISVESPN